MLNVNNKSLLYEFNTNVYYSMSYYAAGKLLEGSKFDLFKLT